VWKVWLLIYGRAGLMTEVLRSLAMEFLAKMRVEVDRVLFFGLGLKIKASRDKEKTGLGLFSVGLEAQALSWEEKA
jgi:hypothetical protein